MDKELLELLNAARASGANESQMQGIVDSYNQKKKNGLNSGGGKQTDVLEEPLSTLAVGSNGQLKESVPTTLQSKESNLPLSTFDPTGNIITKKPIVNVGGIPVKLDIPVPFDNSQKELFSQDLQERINTKTYNPQDIDVVAKSMKVSPLAASAFMDGKVGTGTVIHFNDIKTAKGNQLKATVAKANEDLGRNDNYDEIFASPELAGSYIDKIQKLYTEKNRKESIAAGSKYLNENVVSTPLGPTVIAGSPSTSEISKEITGRNIGVAQQMKDIISNDILEKVVADPTLNKDQKVKRYYELVDGVDKKNVERAISNRLQPFRYMIDVALGGNTTEDIDILNANKAGIEFKVNRSLGEQINYNDALKRSLTEEYLDKVSTGEINPHDEASGSYYTQKIEAINSENIEIAKDVVPDKDLYEKYPVLYKQAVANSINEFNAIRSGNVEGYENGGYEDVNVFEHLKANGFDINDQRVKDVINEGNLKDYSFFGTPLQSVLEVFTSTAKSLGDITGIRDEATILAEKKKGELFPTQVDANDEFQLKSSAKTAQNIANTTGQVIGQGLLQLGTAGLGRMVGLTKVAANGVAFWSSGTLTSYDAALKDSYDFINNPMGRTAYAGLIAMANGASERIFPDVKLFQIPGIKDAISDLSQKIGTQGFTDALATELLGKAKNAFIDFGLKYAKNVSQETVEEVATDLFESGTRYLFGDPNINVEKAIESAKNTAIQTATGTSLIGFFGAYRDIQNERNVSAKSTIYNAAIYHDEALDAINLGFNQNLYSEKERDAKIAVLNTAQQSVEVMKRTELIEGRTLERPERELYVANLTAEATLTAQKKGMDEIGQKAIDVKVSNLQNQRQQILNGEVAIDENGNVSIPVTPTPLSEPIAGLDEQGVPIVPEIKQETLQEESGVVVTPPDKFNEPTTIGGEEQTVTPEIKTEPITVSKSEVLDRQDTPINIDNIGEGFVLHRGGKTGTSEGFNSLDKSRADGYGGKEGGITSSVIKKDAKILKLVIGDTENYKDNEADINEFYKIIGESERQKGSEWADGEMPTDITTRLLNNKSAVDKLKKAGIDIVIGETIDGPDAFIVNEKSIEKIIPKKSQNEETKPTEILNTETPTSVTDESTNKVIEPTKKESAKEKRIADFNKKADNVGKSIIDLLQPAHMKGLKKSGLGVEEVVNAAIAAIKAANVAGENIKEAIETAIKYIKDNLGTDWNDSFEQPLRERFDEIIDNEPPTGETGDTTTGKEGKPKMRSVYKNIIERSKLPEKQKKLLRDDPQALYEVLPNDKAKAIALQIVEEMGVENAVAEASRSTSGLEPFEKVMMLGAAMDYYSGLAKDAAKNNNNKDANHNADLEIDAQEKMQQAAQELAKLGTSLGRGINMFNEVYKLSNIALERKLKKQVNELNKLLNPQVDAAVSEVKDILEDDSVEGIGQGMTDAEIQQMADLKSRVSALEKEIEDLKKQVAANANAPAGSKKNPLNIIRKTNTTEYAKRLKEFAQRHRTGLNTDDLSDLSYFGLYHIENGVTKFADWFGLMSAKFSKFKEHLRNTYISARDTAIQSGADATLFDNEDGIDNHLTDLQDKSDAKKMLQLTKRKAIAENNRKNENNPDQARKEAPRFAAERIRNDAARNLGMLTTKNEQTYLKKLITTIQTKAREYYKEKKENISNVNDILAFAIANGKSDYAIWERTQKEVESQIDADENLSDDEKEEVKGFLNDYTDSVFETLLTGRQQEEIIRQKLIDAGYSTERTVNGKVVKAVDWSNVIGSSKNIKEAKEAIKKAILDVGFTEEEAKNEIDAVLSQFDNKVLEKKQNAVNNYLKKGVINKVKSALGIGNNKTKVQKLVDMNNKGILDDTRIKEVLAKDLGIISLSDEDLKKIRELTTLIDNPKIPSFQKKRYEEQLQYLFDSKGGNLTYLEFREFLANNRLTSMYNNIQNMTGWLRAISTALTIAIKTGSPIKTAKVFAKAFRESISDALTVLLHGDVSRGTAFADLTRSTEGEPRVRYLEQGKGKLLGLPDAYVRVGKKAINLNIFNTAYKGVKYVARVLESADTVPSNVISGLTQYWQIRKQMQLLHPEMSSEQIEKSTYQIMNSTGLAEASKEAMEGFTEAGVVPSKYQLNRAIHEINERNRNEQLNKEFYDTVEATKPEAEQRLINKGNPTPTGEEITKEAYLIMGRDEPLDVVARGERQALRETGKKSTFGLAGLVLWPLNALNNGLKKGMLANHTNTERWVINSGDAAVNFLLPYANSIGRWIEMGIELTPYGVLKGLSYKMGAANLFEGLREGKITKEELGELGDDYIIRGIQGSSMLLGGMYLMSLLNSSGGDDDDEEKMVDVTGTYKNPNFPKEKIQSVGKPDQTLTIKGHKIPLGLMGNAAYPLIMYQDFLDKRTNDNEKHGILYTTAAVYLTTSAQSVQSRLGAFGGIFSGIQSGKEDRYLPQLGKLAGSNIAASTIPFNRLQQEIGQLWNPKSEQSLTFGENLLQQFSIVGALGKAHPSFDYRGREYDFGEVFTGSADGIVKMFEKSKRADNIDRKLAEIDFGATDAFRESKDEENYKYTITDREGTNRFMTTEEYYDFRKATAQKFNEKITKNFDIVDKLSIKVKGEVDENLTKETMNDTYSDMLTTAKEQALELVQAKTGFIPSKKAISRTEKKENKSILKQKKRQLKRLDYE